MTEEELRLIANDIYDKIVDAISYQEGYQSAYNFLLDKLREVSK